MKLFTVASQLAAVVLLAQTATAVPFAQRSHAEKKAMPLSPKIFLIDMFAPEGDVWYGIPEFNLLAQNITVPGLSPLFPEAHCTADGTICQIVTGESEINAATSVSALVFSGYFNLKTTYFLIAGIAGVNPEVATLGSVTFAKYAIQVALQYEFDAREIPTNFSTGYVPLGATSPDEYPQNIYGTEVFEVNEALRDIAMGFAKTATLNDSTTAMEYRARYAPVAAYAAGAAGPSVVGCDVATSDVYYSGTLLSQAFENTTKLFTNGSGVYCSTAQEDNASLEALTRSSALNLTDFSRIIVMRTCSDFDRPPPGESDIDNLFYADQGGFSPSIRNIYLTGVKIIEGILHEWNSTFEAGIKPKNYIGDIFGTLGGTPDFGLPSNFLTKRAEMLDKTRAMESARLSRRRVRPRRLH